MECQKQYNQMPRIHDIICHLVEKGETEPLQKGDTHTLAHPQSPPKVLVQRGHFKKFLLYIESTSRHIKQHRT